MEEHETVVAGMDKILTERIRELKKLSKNDKDKYLPLLGENQAMWAQLQLLKEGRL